MPDATESPKGMGNIIMTKEFTGKLVFISPINLETTYGSISLSEGTEAAISVTINADGTGIAEWEVPEIDEYESIGLWFSGNELIDYDGVFSLPQELIKYLTEHGYNMDWAE